MEEVQDIADYGIAYTGTPGGGNEITVTVTDSVPVAEGETGYQDNAKYYSDLAKAEADNAAKSENAAALSAKASADSATAAADSAGASADSATAAAHSATDAQTILEEIRSDAGNLATKQDLTDLREVVDGKSAILVQDSISTLLSYFSSLAADVYPAGRMNVYLREEGVPDFWISAILPSPIDTPSYGTYRNGAFHVAGKWLPRMEYYEYPDYAVGYYVLTKLETGKIRIPITEWDLVITDKGSLGLLETASGNVLVKGVDIIQSLSVSSSVSLLQFADCHFPMDSEQSITISGTAGTTIRGVLLDGHDMTTSLTISGFGFVEHCYGEYPVQLYLEDCSNIFHCSFCDAHNCHTISDCKVTNDYEGVLFENCQYISNISGGSYGGNDVDFKGCAYLSNIYIADANYENCTYVDVHTCYGYKDTPNIVYGTDGYGEQAKVEINAELDKKLDKATVAPSADSAYVEKKGGGQGLIAIISDDSEPETIVQRNANGQIVTADPTESNHAATMGFVEEQVEAARNIAHYGARWNKTLAQMTRLYDAASFPTDTTNFGHFGSVNANYSNPFDNIYPWSRIRLCNIDLNFYANLAAGDSITKCVKAWEGDVDFSYEDENGVWRYRPEFYGKSWEDSTYRYFDVSEMAIGSYVHYPEAIVGRWHGRAVTLTVGGTNKTCLVPSVGMPAKYIAMSTLHTYAKNYGATIDSIFSIDADVLLCIVEFATMNTQKAIGNGVMSMYRQSSDLIAEDATNSNVVKVLASAASGFCIPGAIFDIGTSNGGVQVGSYHVVTVQPNIGDAQYLDVTLNEAVTVTAANYWSVHGIINVADEEIGSKSGYIGTNGKCNSYYRGLVLFGNMWLYTLGAYENKEDQHIWIANSDEEADKYVALNTSVHYDTGLVFPSTGGYTKKLGMLSRSGLLSIPVFCTEIGGDSNNPTGDYFYNGVYTYNTVLLRGGGAGNGSNVGAFCGAWDTAASYLGWSCAARPRLKNP